MIRPLPLRRYLAVMQARGFDTARVLEGSGIESADLDDAQYLIDAKSYRCVVDNIVRLAGDDAIGMDMGLARELADFRILGYAALACRTVRHSMEEIWDRYGDALGMMAKVAIARSDAATLEVDIVAANMSAPSHRFFVEEALCIMVKIGGQVSGTRARFERMEFSYPAPACLQRYRDLFDCPLRFGAAKTTVTLSRAWLEHPLLTTDEELLGLYQQNLEQLKRQIEAGDTASTRLNSMFVKLDGHIPLLDDAARALGLSPRTLRRQLQQEGASYRGLIAAFRIERTIACLKSTRMSTKQLGEHGGFDDVNAFRRAFKKWTGKTVSEYRLKA